MRSKLARGVVYGVGLSVLCFWAPVAACVAVAKADEVQVCTYLDEHPTVQGVEDLIAIGVFGNGMTPEQVGKFIFDEVNNYCPRHFVTLQAAMDAYGVVPGEARRKI